MKFKVIRDPDGNIDHIETSLFGSDLLGTPKLNKGCAFTREERQQFQLEGLLPYTIETIEQQVDRMYAQFGEHQTLLGKNNYLNVLHDYNETLFYRLLAQHLEEMLPIIYTPIVSQAVENFSLELRKPPGIYLSYENRKHLPKILDHSLPSETDLIVVTDGEAVLGIGDQGTGGIKISNAKLMVYTLCGGLSPHRSQAIQLDVGTNNRHLLSDPLYLGWRHERITGQEYDDFIDLFVTNIQKKFPNIFLHWEDFGKDHAREILNRYRQQLCTLNGDMQSTGTVALACILAGCIKSKTDLKNHRIVIFGAGTAGVGIADQILAALQRIGLSEQEAYQRLWLIDKFGLLMKYQPNLLSFQVPYARKKEDLKNWDIQNKNFVGLEEVIQNVKPTILIGVSAQGGAFTKEIVTAMAANTEKPIIMPLSNPTTKSEAIPEDLLKWTDGRAIIATGTPFPDVEWDGKKIRIALSNNALAFPGIGLGAIAVKAKWISDDMLWAAAEALSKCSPAIKDPTSPLLPNISESLYVSQKIALAVAQQAHRENLAQIPPSSDLDQAIRQICWQPRYYRYDLIK